MKEVSLRDLAIARAKVTGQTVEECLQELYEVLELQAERENKYGT